MELIEYIFGMSPNLHRALVFIDSVVNWAPWAVAGLDYKGGLLMSISFSDWDDTTQWNQFQIKMSGELRLSTLIRSKINQILREIQFKLNIMEKW